MSVNQPRFPGCTVGVKECVACYFFGQDRGDKYPNTCLLLPGETQDKAETNETGYLSRGRGRERYPPVSFFHIQQNQHRRRGPEAPRTGDEQKQMNTGLFHVNNKTTLKEEHTLCIVNT